MKFFSSIIVICVVVLFSTASSKDIVIVDATKERSEKGALLILPGFGSITHGVKQIRDYYKNQGYDLLIPDYISKKSIQDCTDNLDDFITKYKVTEYKEVHVLSYLIGAWSFNPWLAEHQLPNLKNIIYDRSPLQERAPYALVKDSPLLARLVAGKTISEMRDTPYPVCTVPELVAVGILIETKVTKLMLKHRESAMDMGELSWDYKDLLQKADDYIYIPFNHDDLYEVFDIGPEIFYFFEHGKFSPAGSKVSPSNNPLID